MKRCHGPVQASQPRSQALGCRQETWHFLPALPALPPLLRVERSRHERPARAAGRHERRRGREAPWHLARALPPLPTPLPLPPALRRVARTVVPRAVLSRCHTGQPVVHRSAVAPPRSTPEVPRNVHPPRQSLPEQRLGGRCVPPLVHEPLQPVALLIHRAPPGMALPRELAEAFVKRPRGARPGPSRPAPMGLGWPTLTAPLPAGFVGDRDALGKPPLVSSALAEAAPTIPPARVADDLGWEARRRVRVGWRCGFPAAKISCRAASG
jgi:hypothetical protein